MAMGASTARAADTVVAPPPLGQCSPDAPQRQEVRDLTAAQWARYLDAIKTLQKRETPETAAAYDRLAYLHHRYTNAVHNTALFLPWHRLFVRTFEYELQQIDPTVAVPYWDSTQEYQRLASAPFWSSSLLGGDGGRRGVVRSGQLAGWVPFYGAGGHESGGRALGLRRDWAVPRELGSGYGAPRIDAAVTGARSYDRFRKRIEGGMHDLVHALIGGDMNDRSFSPNDPVFWMHHAFIDELWSRWQRRARSHVMAYGGRRADVHRARLSDALPGFGGVRVRDVMRLSDVCVTYDTTVPALPTTTVLRTSAATVAPTQNVFYIATVSNAAGGTVDFEGPNGKALCRDVALEFAVNTWTATCRTTAARVTPDAGRARVRAVFSGDAADAPSSGAVVQRVVEHQPTVLWDPPERVVYGTPLGDRAAAFADRPGQFAYSTLETDGTPSVGLTPDTVLPAGFHVLRLSYTPDSGPPQTLTRQLVVDRAPLVVTPRDQRISTEDPMPPIDYDIDGFVRGESPAVLSGFLRPVCRAARPEGAGADDPRPVGRYLISCEGGDAPNYTIDTSATATLEVLEPGDPRLDQPPPAPALGRGRRIRHKVRKVCSTFHGRLYCGIKGVRGRIPVEIVRHRRVVARGSARPSGSLLEVRLRHRVRVGRYRLVLKSRAVAIRIIPPARARRASATVSLLCRVGNVFRRTASRIENGRRVTRWRVAQAPA
jgi:tyrosinase